MNLIGFEKINSNLSNLYNSGKMSHATIISGKRFIGKASFAQEFALNKLGSQNENHPDLLLVQKDEGKRDLAVDKIRKISKFLSQTSAISKSRFIIIDSADDMNRSSSNALLKILEEPSDNCYLILICHSISKILPTIKSRCQLIKVSDFDFQSFKEALLKIRPSALPPLKDEEIAVLSKICDNTPSKANRIGDEMIFLYENLLQSLIDEQASQAFVKKVAEKNFDFENFIETLEFFFVRYSKYASGVLDELILQEKDAFEELRIRKKLEEIFKIRDEVIESAPKVKSLNLDKKLFLINLISKF